jgi:hypothetical protein
MLVYYVEFMNHLFLPEYLGFPYLFAIATMISLPAFMFICVGMNEAYAHGRLCKAML